VSDQIKVIVFDLGRVLIDFDHQIAAKKIAELTRKDPQKIFELFFDSQLIQSFERGKISAEDFFVSVSRLLGLELSFEKFLSIWNQIFFLSEENKSVYALGKGLKKNLRLALLSNINILHFEYLKSNFPVFDIFNDIFLSCEMGFIKPEPEIYLRVISSLGVLPGEIFYVDDRPELIEASLKLGLRGFVFKGADQLKTDMVSCGINLR
jgi:glucose-1-phosphatase